jgi:hypothetical protein
MLSRCTLSPGGFAPRWIRLNKAEIRMTEAMSPRAIAKLAAMRTAFRVAAIARSFDIGYLVFCSGLRRDSERRLGSRASLVCDGVDIAPLLWPD